MQFNDAEFSKLIADVEKEFSSFLAKSEKTEVATSEVQVLSKSDDEGKKEEPKKEEKEKEEPKEEAKEESKPEHKEEQHEEKPEHKEQEEKPEEKPEHKEEGEEEGHGYDDEDMKHMHEMYGSMNKHELKAHHDSIRAALDKCMAMDKDESGDGEDMQMSEIAKSEASIEIPETLVNSQLELVKSELAAKTAETEELKKSNEELKKSFDLVTQLLNKLVKKSAPQAKAITSVETIAKSEVTPMEKSMDRSEITGILRRKAQDPNLKKSDRDLINAYVLQGASIQTINHLLK